MLTEQLGALGGSDDSAGAAGAVALTATGANPGAGNGGDNMTMTTEASPSSTEGGMGGGMGGGMEGGMGGGMGSAITTSALTALVSGTDSSFITTTGFTTIYESSGSGTSSGAEATGTNSAGMTTDASGNVIGGAGGAGTMTETAAVSPIHLSNVMNESNADPRPSSLECQPVPRWEAALRRREATPHPVLRRRQAAQLPAALPPATALLSSLLHLCLLPVFSQCSLFKSQHRRESSYFDYDLRNMLHSTRRAMAASFGTHAMIPLSASLALIPHHTSTIGRC